MKFLNTNSSDGRAARACGVWEEAAIPGRRQLDVKAPAASCEGLVSPCHTSTPQTRTGSQQPGLRPAARLSATAALRNALHKNRASQFRVLMGILGGKAEGKPGPSCQLQRPDIPAQRTRSGDHAAQVGASGSFSLFPFARATWVWLPPTQQKRQKFGFRLNTIRQHPVIHHWLQLFL